MAKSPQADSTVLWDDAAFKARVKAIARSQDRFLGEVMKTAGLSRNYLQEHPTVGGRSITSIARLARSLGVPISELVEDRAVLPDLKDRKFAPPE